MRFEHHRLGDRENSSAPITLVMVDGSRHQLAEGQWVEIEQDSLGRFLCIVERGELPADERPIADEDAHDRS